MATITINGGRFSYAHLFQPVQRDPKSDPKYSTTFLLPKSEAGEKARIDAAIEDAINRGVAKAWQGQRPPIISIPVYDGDGVRPSDGSPFGDECKGCWVFTATSKQPPFVVDTMLNAIINPTEVYSGMYGNISVTFFPYNFQGRKGIGCALNGVQKIRDGEPLSGRVTAAEAFTAQPQNAAPAATSPVNYGAPAPGYQAPAAPSYNPAPGYAPAPAPAAGSYQASGYAPAQTPTPAPAAGGYYINPATGEVSDTYVPGMVPYSPQ